MNTCYKSGDDKIRHGSCVYVYVYFLVKRDNKLETVLSRDHWLVWLHCDFFSTDFTYNMKLHIYTTEGVYLLLFPGPCYYVGSSQGGRTGEREENESVIEGRYTDYQVSGLFDDDFAYSQFERERCTDAA